MVVVVYIGEGVCWVAVHIGWCWYVVLLALVGVFLTYGDYDA